MDHWKLGHHPGTLPERVEVEAWYQSRKRQSRKMLPRVPGPGWHRVSGL